MSVDVQFLRDFILRLDRQNDLLAQLINLLAAEKSKTVDQFGQVRSALDLMVSVGLPATPALTREITVTPTPTLLASNDTLALARVDITNDDVAQPLWVSGPNVLINTGRVILAQVTVPYVLPRGTQVWGVCAVAFISVRVSDLYNVLGMLEATQR